LARSGSSSWGSSWAWSMCSKIREWYVSLISCTLCIDIHVNRQSMFTFFSLASCMLSNGVSQNRAAFTVRPERVFRHGRMKRSCALGGHDAAWASWRGYRIVRSSEHRIKSKKRPGKGHGHCATKILALVCRCSWTASSESEREPSTVADHRRACHSGSPALTVAPSQQLNCARWRRRLMFSWC
jgi:hypothetical protein